MSNWLVRFEHHDTGMTKEYTVEAPDLGLAISDASGRHFDWWSSRSAEERGLWTDWAPIKVERDISNGIPPLEAFIRTTLAYINQAKEGKTEEEWKALNDRLREMIDQDTALHRGVGTKVCSDFLRKEASREALQATDQPKP